MIEKICQNKLNYTAEVCGNLTFNEDIQDEVQRNVTDYESQQKMLALIPRQIHTPCNDTCTTSKFKTLSCLYF